MRVLAFLACFCVSVAAAGAAWADGLVPGDQAKFDQGAAAFDAGNYTKAFHIFSRLARHGDLAAMRNVALMERKGLGTDKDPEAAQELYLYVASAGLPTAQYDLAEMLLHGEAGDPRPKEAAKWFALAASVHHPLAEYELGKMYEEGTVLDKNLDQAKALYAEASARGVWDATVRLAALRGEPPPKPPTQPGLQPAEPVAGP
ncbi:MAG TPA: tetratricopeptide repeat protein [Rhizomicrobium sp.]|nr:tetratricopeptide repeat protein [Rhizomicrobium sp.]